MNIPHIAVVGATASGKSNISIELAKQFDYEVISLDSMQIYRGMEVGTGVVSEKERQGIHHYMIGIVDPQTEYSVSNFQTDVKKIINKDKEKKYVFAGGTGLYTHAVIDDYSLAPTDRNVRDEIEEKFNLYEVNTDLASLEDAYKYLKKVDEEAARKIEPNNVRRIVRALEVIEITGEKFSGIGEGIQTFEAPSIDIKIIGLRYSREALKDRIVSRVNTMMTSGWIEEVESLTDRWENLAPNARTAIGYQNIVDWIRDDKPELELAKVKEKIINKTSQFSRRQRKWFERDPRIIWIECDEKSSSQIFEDVLKAISVKS